MPNSEKDRLIQISEKIRDMQTELADKRSAVVYCESETERIELQTYMDVCAKKDDTGKPLHTNDKARAAAVQAWLADVKDKVAAGYMSIKSRASELKKEIDEISAEIEHRRNVLRIELAFVHHDSDNGCKCG